MKDGPTPLRQASVFAALLLFWVAMSGMFTPFLLAAGAASALAVLWMARRMDIVDSEGWPLQLGARIGLYWVWLLREVVKSAWNVARIIVDPRLPISPVLLRIVPSQKTSVGLVLYANSITLTPGTITIEAAADSFLVHALTRAGAADLAAGEMDRRVSTHEGAGRSAARPQGLG